VQTLRHVAIIRSRLDRFLRELRSAPGRDQSDLIAAVESVLLELDGKLSESAQSTGRVITLSEIRDRLTGLPDARHLLDAIDSAIADGSD